MFTGNITTVDCGFLSNIVFDYEDGVITNEKEFKWMLQVCNLTFADESKLVKWYNKARENGAMSVAHFKLVCIVCDIIKANRKLYYQRTICPTIHRGCFRWINIKC